MKVSRVIAMVVAVGLGLLPSAANASTGWAIQPTPDPGGLSEGAYNDLEAVSCISAASCTATGYYGGYGNDQTPLSEFWNGKSWQVQSTSNPTTTAYNAGELRGVKCISGTFCMAVGEYSDSSGNTDTLGEIWNGSAWSIVPTSNPAGSSASQLNAIACTTTANCLAAGYYQASSSLPLLERWNGTSWSLMSAPATSGAYLEGISCTSAKACTAVGYVGSNGLAERWNGSTWKSQSLPKPTGATSIQLNGVKCASGSVCFAAGSASFSGNITKPLVERWSSGAWKAQSVPVPADSSGDDALEAISCVSAINCSAAGNTLYPLNSGYLQATLAEVWNGTSWKVQSTPGDTEAWDELLGIACSTATTCTAVGEGVADDGPGTSRTLAMQKA